MTSNRSAEKSAAAFRTISEVSDDLQVPQHVLRFWETKFAQVRPMKRGGGRRYYRPEDIELLRSIRDLLYSDGYTIKGVQKLLREGQVESGGTSPSTSAVGAAGACATPAQSPPDTVEAGPATAGDAAAKRLGDADRQALQDVLEELLAARASLTRDGA